MIETDYFILTPEQYEENLQHASVEGVSLDYYLLEFCNIEGEWVVVEWKGGRWKCPYSMTHFNPYVQNLIEMGYDEQDCRNVAAVGETNVTYPRTIYGRTFATETEYKEALADFINGMWFPRY